MRPDLLLLPDRREAHEQVPDGAAPAGGHQTSSGAEHAVDELLQLWETTSRSPAPHPLTRLRSAVARRRLVLVRVTVSVLLLLLVRLIVVSNIGFLVPTQQLIVTPGPVQPVLQTLPDGISQLEGQGWSPNSIHAYSAPVDTRSARLIERIRAWVRIDRGMKLTPEPTAGAGEALAAEHDSALHAANLGLASGAAAAGAEATIVGAYFVSRVERGTPADSAGLQPGDRIVEVDGKLPRYTARAGYDLAPERERVTVTVERQQRRQRVVLSRQDRVTSWGLAGVWTGSRFAGDPAPAPEQTFGSHDESSALAMAMAAYEALAPDARCGVPQYAAAGALSAGGTVEPVGFVDLRLAAVSAAGLRHFLVPADTPASELEQARQLRVHVVRVRSVEEAVRWLRSWPATCSRGDADG